MQRDQFDILRAKNSERSLLWTGETKLSAIELGFRSLELGGESGEFQEAIKKLIRSKMGWAGGIDLDAAKSALGEEFADCMITVDRLAALFDINIYYEVRFTERGLICLDYDPVQAFIDIGNLVGIYSGQVQAHCKNISDYGIDVEIDNLLISDLRNAIAQYVFWLLVAIEQFDLGDKFALISAKFNKTSEKHGFDVKL